MAPAVIIKTPEGKFAVIDPGPANRPDSWSTNLRWMGAQTLDVIITNPTKSHVGALAGLLDSFSVGRLIHGPHLAEQQDLAGCDPRCGKQRVSAIRLSRAATA